MTAPAQPPGTGPERDPPPDRLFWNLAVFMLIPVLVLLLVAAWLARRAEAPVPRGSTPQAAPGP